MAISFLLLVLLLFLSSSLSSSAVHTSLNKGSSLCVENTEDVLVSPNGKFSAGFYPVGENAYSFAIWFSKPSCRKNCTIVWMANRNLPINGIRSKLSLLRSGNLILTDAGKSIAWATNTVSHSSVQLLLHGSGNLVLRSSEDGTLWQSFNSPTDTLLPGQQLTRNTMLVSSRSKGNYSSGFYKLSFDNDNALRLLFDGPDFSSIYWFDPWLLSWEAGRSTYNNSRVAAFDAFGNFSSSDNFTFLSADYGEELKRRLTMDYDGNVRLYSREETTGTWVVAWQAISQPCRVHGVCGANSICTYVPEAGRKCTCLPGYKMKNRRDWSHGCEPEFDLSCNPNHARFIQLPHVEFYGYDYAYTPNCTLEMCEKICLELCNCKGFQFRFIEDHGFFGCYHKTLLLNGHHSPSFGPDFFVKLPNNSLFSYKPDDIGFSLDCSGEVLKQQDRTYTENKENGVLKFMLLFAFAFGGVEFIGIFLVLWLLVKTHTDSDAEIHGYSTLAATVFKRFTYAELKKATRNFNDEIGRGAGGIVYKGILSDNRVAAIKKLNEAKQGEDQFQAEVSIIGKLNHTNLIEIWGYCAERRHRLLVYKYMEYGSLAENLSSNTLDWKKRFDIALGTARGLAYLHEECLEWVLHCDVKPENILLDFNYQPKLSDFGLSKLLNRSDGPKNLSFSRIRGTRGYIAPEWILNQPITSKVDVYSYGMVVLEMITGKKQVRGIHGEIEHTKLVPWVREKMNGTAAMPSQMETIIDAKLEGNYDMSKLEILVAVALKCVLEDKDARPTMSQVVEMLLCHENSVSATKLEASTKLLY